MLHQRLKPHLQVSTHSRLKAAGFDRKLGVSELLVSTHSRLKAAGCHFYFMTRLTMGFNTQPPEGGWLNFCLLNCLQRVSTHSRLKAAGLIEAVENPLHKVSTHSRLKAAGKVSVTDFCRQMVSTHSRLKAAGFSKAQK